MGERLSRKQKAEIRHLLWQNSDAQITFSDLVLLDSDWNIEMIEEAEEYAHDVNDSRYSIRDQRG